MNEKLERTLLYSTFQHLPRIGPVKEKSLWDAGIEKWDDFEKKSGKQLKLFQNGKDKFDDLITDSKEALRKRNLKFFVERLAPKEHYRIPLSFPDEVIFLDIETTGLSTYYDEITLIGWSKDKRYKTILGNNDSYGELIHDLEKSTTIVTYNGTLFDIPFLKRDIPNLKIPQCHIDLRYACLRSDLTGGQKSIEDEIGFERSSDLENLKSENAPTLWYKYQYGDSEALKQLIRYNQADVEGMKFILDYLISEYLGNEEIPLDKGQQTTFFNGFSSLFFTEKKEKEFAIYIPKYKGDVGPKIKYDELDTQGNLLNDFKVVGIDLTGSKKRETGWAYIQNKQVSTTLLKTDEAIINETLKEDPNLISIDSPLSLPEGRITVFDDDPGREEYGIMRECERILKRRGINVYPSLIPSMQKLTKRGINLASRFRKLGYPVIESYPGAVQDIIGIPRKGTSIEFLKQGLIHFGLEGIPDIERITHDELDAITSATVGLFFWIGKFEALGNEIEEYLIIPDLEIENDLWLNRKVIGISGPIAAGKTTTAKMLEQENFQYGRYSLVLKEMLKEENREVNRENLQKIGEKVNRERGQRWLGYKLIRSMSEESNLVIDGLRFPEDHAFMIENFGPAFIHLYIEAEENIREQRYLNKEEFELANNHEVEREVKKLKKLSTNVIHNEDSKSFLRELLFKTLNINQN